MTVNEYISMLDEAIKATVGLCNQNPGGDPCKGCPIGKNDGKPCPIAQLNDVKRALEYAVSHNVNGINENTETYSATVIAFLRRAVVMGYSIRTLRFCSDDFIKERNLIEIPIE